MFIFYQLFKLEKTLVRKIIYPDIILSFLHRAFIKYRIYLYLYICDIYYIDIYVSIYKSDNG